MTSESTKALDEAELTLKSAFDKAKAAEGLTRSRLKTRLDFSNRDFASTTQLGCVKGATTRYAIEDAELAPATPDLRRAANSPLLKDDAREGRHSLAYKATRLAKRARPEASPATHLLSTRAQNPAEEDAAKARRCLKRLSGAMELGLGLNATSPTSTLRMELM